MDPIKVSAADYKRLEQLQAMREGPKAADPVKAAESDERYQAWLKGEKRDVAGEVWDTTKKVGKVYLLVAVPLAIMALAVVIGIWMMMAHQVTAYDQQSAQIQAEHPALPMANWHPTPAECDEAKRQIDAILSSR